MKKVYFTDKQLQEIIGCDYKKFINEKEDDDALPQNIGGNSVAVIEPIKDKTRNYSGPITNKVAHEKSRQSYYGGHKGPTLYEAKKKLNEINQDFENKKISLPSDMLNRYQTSNPSSTLGHVIKDGHISASNAYKEISDRKNGKGSTLPDEMIDWMQDNLDGLERTSQNKKVIRANMGMENSFQKPGGTKKSGNGKAHSEKPVNITYEN